MPNTLLCFATQAGGTTLDRDAFGGNPFASALIAYAPGLRTQSAARWAEDLRKKTFKLSGRHQAIDFALPAESRDLPLASGRTIALLLICANYEQMPCLPGAAFDKQRIAAALAFEGMSLLQNSGEHLSALKSALTEFSRLSKRFDTALIYATGHGLQQHQRQYLLPADIARGHRLSSANALPVSRLVDACRARERNLVFFAGRRQVHAPMGRP